MKRILALACATAIYMTSFGQSPVKLKINHLIGDKTFTFSEKSKNNLGDDFQYSRMEYYLSNFSLVHDGGKVTKTPNVYALVNATQATEIDMGSIDVTTIEAINFSVGVHPDVNNQDPTQWPKDHPLYPKMPSMHWGWASGYRFVAMEGKARETFNTVFEVHALGNQNFFDINIPISATDNNGTLMLELNADYEKAVTNLFLSQGVVTHGDYDEAITVLRNFQNRVFTTTTGQGNTLSTEDVSMASVTTRVYPNPSSGQISVSAPASGNSVATIRVTDLSGRLVTEKTKMGETATFTISESGLYLVAVEFENGMVETHRVSIL